jgi:transposase
MNDINPWDYIIDVLQRVDSHSAREVAQITPKYWKDLIAGKFDAS